MRIVYKVVRRTPSQKLVSAHVSAGWTVEYRPDEWTELKNNSLLFAFSEYNAASYWRSGRSYAGRLEIWAAITDHDPIPPGRIVWNAELVWLKAFWVAYHQGESIGERITMEAPTDTVMAQRLKLVRYIS